MTTPELEKLAREAVQALTTANLQTRTILLVNSRTDVAFAVGADGVHLRADDVSPAAVRSIWSRGAGVLARVTVALSCHSDADVAAARGADFCVFAPVFEKTAATATGLAALHQACRHAIPVLALGGVTLQNAQQCLSAGAAGVAGIRLFQENHLSDLVPKLRALR